MPLEKNGTVSPVGKFLEFTKTKAEWVYLLLPRDMRYWISLQTCISFEQRFSFLNSRVKRNYNPGDLQRHCESSHTGGYTGGLAKLESAQNFSGKQWL